MRKGLTSDLIKSNFKEFFVVEKGVYKDTPENRKLGRVGQKYREKKNSYASRMERTKKMGDYHRNTSEGKRDKNAKEWMSSPTGKQHKEFMDAYHAHMDSYDKLPDTGSYTAEHAAHHKKSESFHRKDIKFRNHMEANGTSWADVSRLKDTPENRKLGRVGQKYRIPSNKEKESKMGKYTAMLLGDVAADLFQELPHVNSHKEEGGKVYFTVVGHKNIKDTQAKLEKYGVKTTVETLPHDRVNLWASSDTLMK